MIVTAGQPTVSAGVFGIAQTYERYLGRPADSGGLAYWLSQYQQGAINEDIVAAFIRINLG